MTFGKALARVIKSQGKLGLRYGPYLFRYDPVKKSFYDCKDRIVDFDKTDMDSFIWRTENAIQTDNETVNS